MRERAETSRDPLTPREAQCADLVGQGWNNQSIARIMGLRTVKAVENLLTRVYLMLGLARSDDFAQRVALAFWARGMPLHRYDEDGEAVPWPEGGEF